MRAHAAQARPDINAKVPIGPDLDPRLSKPGMYDLIMSNHLAWLVKSSRSRVSITKHCV